MRNYLALLGWGFDDSTTFFTTPELVERFSLERVSKSPAIFDEKKLRWMNGHYLRQLEREDLTRRLELRLGRSDLREAVGITQEKMQTLDDFWPLAGFLDRAAADDEPDAWRKVMRDGAFENLRRTREVLARVEPFDREHVEQALTALVEELAVKPGRVYQPIRVAISGRSSLAGDLRVRRAAWPRARRWRASTARSGARGAEASDSQHSAALRALRFPSA